MATKLKAPEGCAGFGMGGVPVEIDENGIAEVSNNPVLVQNMLDHGFTIVPNDEPKKAPLKLPQQPGKQGGDLLDGKKEGDKIEAHRP